LFSSTHDHYYLKFFYVLLTVRLSSNLVNVQLVAQLFYFIIFDYSSPHVSSNVVLIIGSSNCTNTASGIVTHYKWPSGLQVETCIPDGHLQTVSISNAVLVKFDLLMMSTTLFETCRGL